MSQRVPNWDLDECPDSSRIHPPDHNSSKPPLAPRLGYEVAELTWENGQLSMHGLGQRRSTDKNLSKCNWEKSPAEDTLECVVNQASRIISLPTVNYQATDALVPSAGSGLPDKTDSGKQLTVDDHDSVCHGRSQREDGEEDGKKKVQTARSSSSTKRTRAAAIHNQSERKRRDRINEKMKALQKLVPNSSKTDKASMLDEVIEYLKQLKAQVQMMSRMNNMSHMMIPMTMQQFQMAMMAQMQMSMGMNMGMGMNLMDMNSISRQALAGVTGTGISPTIHPTAFLPFPASWENPNDRSSQQLQQQDVFSNFLGCQMQPMNMDAYTRMAALYQQLHQSSPQVPNTTKD